MFDVVFFIFVGLRNINDVNFFAGVGLSIGVIVLFEGWINLFLEFLLTYCLFLVFFSFENGFFSDQ